MLLHDRMLCQSPGNGNLSCDQAMLAKLSEDTCKVVGAIGNDRVAPRQLECDPLRVKISVCKLSVIA